MERREIVKTLGLVRGASELLTYKKAPSWADFLGHFCFSVYPVHLFSRAHSLFDYAISYSFDLIHDLG